MLGASIPVYLDLLGGTMKRSGLPFRIVGVAGVLALLALALIRPAGALATLVLQTTPEPTARPTATPAPYVQVTPNQGVSGVATAVTASGGFWSPGHTVQLYWDSSERFLGQVQVRGDGTWQLSFTTPTAPAPSSPGTHQVLVVSTDGATGGAPFEMLPTTPTNTPTSTFTASPTNTKSPTTPPPTPTNTATPTPSPTLRPVTPMVTITPLPPTQAPAQPTRRPRPTNTPLAGTATPTRTPSITPTASNTPGPGTPSATPRAVATATPLPDDEMAETGGGWGSVFLWGFVLAGLLVVFRLLRLRSLQGPS